MRQSARFETKGTTIAFRGVRPIDGTIRSSFVVAKKKKIRTNSPPSNCTLHPPLFTFHWLPVVHPRNRSRVTTTIFLTEIARKFPRKWISPLYRINVTEFAPIFDLESKKILIFGNELSLALQISCLTSAESNIFPIRSTLKIEKYLYFSYIRKKKILFVFHFWKSLKYHHRVHRITTCHAIICYAPSTF